MLKYDTRTLTKEKKRRILDLYDHLCVYCFDHARHVDHVVPWCHSHDDSDDNLVAACKTCNLLVSNKIFDTFELKRSYIQEQRYKMSRKTPIPLWTVYEIDELGAMLRSHVEASAVILDDDIQRLRVKDILVEQGCRVSIDGKYYG